MTIPDLLASIEIACSPDEAFRRFVRLEEWWPPEYTWSGPVLERIGIEPRRGGHCFEEGPHGFRLDWGWVLEWEPPRRLLFSWHIAPDRTPAPDPARASEVEVRFAATDRGATLVRLTHRDFSRHGEGGAEYRQGLASRRGWPWLLKRFAALET